MTDETDALREAPEVTEEMVERACVGWFSSDDLDYWVNTDEDDRARIRVWMRAALRAALGTGGLKDGK